MHPFVGRQKELKQLKNQLDRNIASLIVVKGRRRIGKSRLIAEFAKGTHFISISGLTPGKQVTAQHQRAEFAKQLARIFQIPLPAHEDWSDLFWALAQQTQKGRVIILLDEISWMGMKDPTFLGKLKNIWDSDLKKNPKLMLVLCGSVSSWIEKNILSSTAFVGRIDLTLSLSELSLHECNDFWGSRKDQISSYEKFKILSLTGGVPRYLESIVTKQSAEENIRNLCFTEGGFFFDEFNKVFTDLFSRRGEIYKNILLCLIQHPHATLNDIFEFLNMKRTGTMSQYLEDLITAGFIRRDYTWSIQSEKQSKLSQYRISDNYVRFYLKYILPNKAKIENGAFTEKAISSLPGWDAIMGLQFENLVLHNRQLVKKCLNIEPGEVIQDNAYFQKASASQSGCQIDYLIQTRFNTLYICEIKFSKNLIGPSIINEMKEKISKLDLPRNFSYRPVLIQVNGVEDSVIESEFFSNIVEFGEMLR